MEQACWFRKIAVSLAWQPTSYKIRRVIHPSKEAVNSLTTRLDSVYEAAVVVVCPLFDPLIY